MNQIMQFYTIQRNFIDDQAREYIKLLAKRSENVPYQ